MDRVILVWVALFAFLAAAPFVLPYRFSAMMVSLAGLSFSAIAVTCGVLCLLHKAPGARYFLLAWTLLLIGVAATAARNFGWIPTNELTSHAMQIGSALEMLLLSSALADRINTLRRETEHAHADSMAAKQAMVDALRRNEQELELRVAGRTRELSDTNTRLEESQKALHHMAYRDTLTGLVNRALMEDRIDLAIARAKRDNSLVAILLVDLDRFKPVNDSFGHAVGDEVLKEIAARLKQCVRGSDTVARIGGDEFVVVLDQLHVPEHASRVAKSITGTLGRPFDAGGHAIRIGASVGLALYPHHGTDAQSLIRHADQAMYLAKAAEQGGAPGTSRLSTLS